MFIVQHSFFDFCNIFCPAKKIDPGKLRILFEITINKLPCHFNFTLLHYKLTVSKFISNCLYIFISRTVHDVLKQFFIQDDLLGERQSAQIVHLDNFKSLVQLQERGALNYPDQVVVLRQQVWIELHALLLSCKDETAVHRFLTLLHQVFNAREVIYFVVVREDWSQLRL